MSLVNHQRRLVFCKLGQDVHIIRLEVLQDQGDLVICAGHVFLLSLNPELKAINPKLTRVRRWLFSISVLEDPWTGSRSTTLEPLILRGESQNFSN